MDPLSQYKQSHPEAFQEKKPSPPTDEYGRAYSRMVAFVMRLSGGRIKDARQASYVLLAGAILIAMISLRFYLGIPGLSSSPKAFTPSGYSDIPR